MLMTSERRPGYGRCADGRLTCFRTLASSASAGARLDEGAADPHAWERAIDIAREDPPAGVSPDTAAAEVRNVLNSIGDTFPECPLTRGIGAEH